MDAIELDIHRQNTTAFIADRPSTIALIPTERIKTPAAGYKDVDQPPRAPQTFRIIELGMQTTPQILTLTDGTQRIARFWLLGEWNAEMEFGDHWYSEDGRHWVIGDILRDNGYEQRGLVAERGR